MVEIGRTTLLTRRQRLRLGGIVVLIVAAALVCLWVGAALVAAISGHGWVWPHLGVRSPISGVGGKHSGGLLGVPQQGHTSSSSPGARWPVTFSVAGPLGWSIFVAGLLWAGVIMLIGRRFQLGTDQTRKEGLASVRLVRRKFGAHAARANGAVTRPGMSRVLRWLAAPAEFGMCFGHPEQPKARFRLWARFERPLRVVAYQGWGKTFRLLVPIARALPGPALISSVEPEIYSHTMPARAQRRLHLRWSWLDVLARPLLRTKRYPVWVADFAPQGLDWAPGAARVRWSAIPDCTDHDVAARRAHGIMADIDSDSSSRGSDEDWFFRESAAAVLAAFLHAAALGGKHEDTLAGWLGSLAGSPDPTPGEILESHPRAAPVALQHWKAHLDPRAERTTSAVVRFLTLAMQAFLDPRGRAFCGLTDPHVPQFDMEAAIAEGATVYLLSDTQSRGVSGPLLSMFANEYFFAAQRVAQRRPGRRLDPPFVGILDELRYGVKIDQLPYVASTMRKNGILFCYAALTATNEESVYGQEAAALRNLCGVNIFGGADEASAETLSKYAGNQKVVHGGYAMGRPSEQVADEPVLTLADQQAMPDGEAVIRAREAEEFTAFMPYCLAGRTGRRIRREAHQALTAAGRGVPPPPGPAEQTMPLPAYTPPRDAGGTELAKENTPR
jgi:hypothetical protein